MTSPFSYVLPSYLKNLKAVSRNEEKDVTLSWGKFERNILPKGPVKPFSTAQIPSRMESGRFPCPSSV
jgi:hypothetical protein